MTNLQIAKLYVAVNGTAPTAAELATLSASATTAADIMAMVDFTGADNTATLNAAYQAAFGRDADAEGLAYWGAELTAGNVTGATLMEKLLVGADVYVSAGDATIAALNTADKGITANKATVAVEIATAGLTATEAATALALVTATDTAAASASVTAVVDAAAAQAAADAAAAAAVGSTFTFTTAIDTLTGTTGNDTFVGDAATLTNADQIAGNAGTDTAKLYNIAAQSDIPTMDSIENIELISIDNVTVAANLDFSTTGATSLTFNDTITTSGIATKLLTVGADQKITVSNMLDTESITLTTTATDTAADLTFNAMGTLTAAAGVTVNMNGAALTTLNVASAGNASQVTLTSTGAVTTLNVTGDQALTINTDPSAAAADMLLTTVNASTMTGNLNITLEDDTTPTNATVTTGSGDDTVNFGAAFTSADKATAGAGTDTLQMTQASITTVEAYNAETKAIVNANIDGFEVLKVTDAATSAIDMSRYDGIDSLVLGGGLNAAAVTVTNIQSGFTAEIQAAATTAATDTLVLSVDEAQLAGHNNDSVNLVFSNALNTAIDLGNVSLVGIDNLNIEAKDTATGVASGYTIDISSAATLDTLVLTGSADLNLSTALVNSITSVDASAATGDFTVSIAGAGTSGVVIDGTTNASTVAGAAINTLTGGAGGDIITSHSASADIITGGAGNDVMTGGAGNDTFNFADGDSGVTASSFDTITDYTNTTSTASSDTIVFTTNAGAGVIGTTALTGYTITNGMAVKSGATLAEFITAVQAAGTADETYGFVVGADTYVYSAGANGTTNATDDVLIQLTGFVGSSIVTADTTTANEILIG